MRAPLAWALLLAVFGTINAIWTHDGIQVAEFGFAVLVILCLAVGLWLRGRERAGPAALRSASLAAAVAGLGVASIVFGLAFGHFPMYFGAGLLLAALGRLAFELRSQRRTEERWRRR